uniref:Uncharacterized protein n=1 Tax=Onchocerca volvulus TaxID=6282 RepID=A0A8R1TLH2_ONCVO
MVKYLSTFLHLRRLATCKSFPASLLANGRFVENHSIPSTMVKCIIIEEYFASLAIIRQDMHNSSMHNIIYDRYSIAIDRSIEISI